MEAVEEEEVEVADGMLLPLAVETAAITAAAAACVVAGSVGIGGVVVGALASLEHLERRRRIWHALGRWRASCLETFKDLRI